jgi:hypothetical protein
MNSPADSHEMTILESKGILIHDQIFHAVLTDRRIILTRYSDNKLSIGSIYLADIQKIEEDSDDSGDPLIIVVTSSATGEIKKVVFHFSQKNFPDPHQVSSLWASEINVLKQPTIPFSPGDIPKKDSVGQAFCVKCGTKFTDGSAFCNLCGTKIIYPIDPIPLQQVEESIRKNVKTSYISIEEIVIIEEPVKPEQETIPLFSADNSDASEKVPIIAQKPTEQPKKRSFFTGSFQRKHAIIVVISLVSVILLITAFFVFVPSGSIGFNLTFPGTNFTVPSFNGTPSTTSQLVTTPTVPNTARIPATPVQTRTSVRTRPIPVQTTKP